MSSSVDVTNLSSPSSVTKKALEQIVHNIDKVFIDQASLQSKVCARVQSLFPANKIEIVTQEPLASHKGMMTPDEFNASKRNLFVTPFKGQFFKRCPGATQKKTLSCCNYYVLNLGSQCNMNCSYCYLQSYLNSPVMKIYSNIDQALEELDAIAREQGSMPFRVGTGEVIDSLSLDPLTQYSRELIAFFKKYPQWKLEFKTKSNLVDQFLSEDHSENVIVSWSINADIITQREEHLTASLNERLMAARKCADHGFPVAFHIDPMIYHENWELNYADVVNRITALFKPEEVHIISIGTLRFQPEQKQMMRERFGFSSLVMSGELFPSEGGKMRYDSVLRGQMYKHVYTTFKNHNPNWNIFLCMETPETWISSFDKTAQQIPELKQIFRPLSI